MDPVTHSGVFGLAVPSSPGARGSACADDAVARSGPVAPPRRGSRGIAALGDGQPGAPCAQCCSRRLEAFPPRGSRQGPPGLTLPLLKNFDSLAEFLLRFERITDYWQCDDRGKVLYLEEALEGSHIQNWFANYLKFYGHHTYKNIELNLRLAFCDKDESRKYRMLLDRRSWNEKESVRDYFWDKCMLMHNYSENMQLWEKIDFIKKGMPVSWQSKLAGMVFQDMGEMLDKLVCLESDLLHLGDSAPLPTGDVTSPLPTAERVDSLSILARVTDTLSSMTEAMTSTAENWGSRQELPLQPYSRGGETASTCMSSGPSRDSRDRSGHAHRNLARVRETVYVHVPRSRSSSRDRWCMPRGRARPRRSRSSSRDRGSWSRRRDGASRSRSRSWDRGYRMDSRDREGRGERSHDRGEVPHKQSVRQEPEFNSKNGLA